MLYEIKKFGWQLRLYQTGTNDFRLIGFETAKRFISNRLAENLTTIDFNNVDLIVRAEKVDDVLAPVYGLYQRVYNFAPVSTKEGPTERDHFSVQDDELDDEMFIEEPTVSPVEKESLVFVTYVDRVEAEYWINKGAVNLAGIDIKDEVAFVPDLPEARTYGTVFMPDGVGDYAMYQVMASGDLHYVKTFNRSVVHEKADEYPNSTIFKVDTGQSQEKKSTFWQKISNFFALLFARR